MGLSSPWFSTVPFSPHLTTPTVQGAHAAMRAALFKKPLTGEEAWAWPLLWVETMFRLSCHLSLLLLILSSRDGSCHQAPNHPGPL